MKKMFITPDALDNQEKLAITLRDGTQAYTDAILGAINPVPKHDLPIAVAALTGALDTLVEHASDDELDIAAGVYALLDGESKVTISRRRAGTDEQDR